MAALINEENFWRLLRSNESDPALNLAIEEAVCRSVGAGNSPNTVRVWRNAPSVIIGRNQRAEFEANLEFCRSMQIKVVRRFSGGGAVYHDFGNLNFSVLRRKDLGTICSRDAFTWFGAAIMTGLAALGLEATYEHPNSIFINGLKACGFSAAMQWGCLALHACVLVQTDLKVLHAALTPNKDVEDGRYVQSNRVPVTNISDVVGRGLTITEVEKALLASVINKTRISLIDGELSKPELAMSSELYQEKYSSQHWNMGSTPFEFLGFGSETMGSDTVNYRLNFVPRKPGC